MGGGTWWMSSVPLLLQIGKTDSGMAGNSLKDIDPVKDTLERLRLDRDARSKGVLVTEGPTDESVLSSALGIDRRTLFPAGGRKNLLRIAETLEASPLGGVICVGDRDFDASESSWPQFWWLVFYDNADVEAMLIEAEPLARFLDEWATKDKLEETGGVEGVRAILRERVSPMSSLRSANAENHLGIPFDSIELVDVIDKKSGSISRASLVGKLAAKGEWTHKELEEAMEANPPMCPHTSEPLARGRDLMSVLSVLLRQLIGSLNQQQVKGRLVERSIRLAVRKGDFDGTAFKQRLDAAMALARQQLNTP